MVSEPPRDPFTAISLVPRQVVIAMNATTKEVNQKKKKDKKAEDDRHHSDSKSRGAPLEEGKAVLLRSIASFLDANGFSKTLAAFRSEAQPEKDEMDVKPLDLEEVFCRFLDLSKTSVSQKGTLSKAQDTDVSRKDQKSEMADACKSDLDATNSNYDEAVTDSKKKKHKKRSISDVANNNEYKSSLEVAKENVANVDIAILSNAVIEDYSKTEDKKKSIPVPGLDLKSEQIDSPRLREFVKEKLEDLKCAIQSNADQLNESDRKSKSNKKKKHTSGPFPCDVNPVRSETAQETAKIDGSSQTLEQLKKDAAVSRKDQKSDACKSDLDATNSHYIEAVTASNKKKHKKSHISDIANDYECKSSFELLKENVANVDVATEDYSKTEDKEKSLPAPGLDLKSEQIDSPRLREFVNEKLEDLKCAIQSSTCQINESDQKSKSNKKKKHTSGPFPCDAILVRSDTAQETAKVDGNSETLEQVKKESVTDDLTPMECEKGKKKRKKKSSPQLENLEAMKEKSTCQSQADKQLPIEVAMDIANTKKSKKKEVTNEEENQTINGSDAGQALEDNKKASKKKKHQKIDAVVHPEGDNDCNNGKEKNQSEVDLKPEDESPMENIDKHLESTGTHADHGNKNPTSVKAKKKQEIQSGEPTTVKAFQRVKVGEVKFVDERLKDNSYWAKGGADKGYGAKAQEVLEQVKGRNFKHEKTKKKRGSYRGGQIDFQSHSIKFNESEDE